MRADLFLLLFLLILVCYGICNESSIYFYGIFSPNLPNVTTLALKFQRNKEEISRCRVVGILSSSHGCFYIGDINETMSNSKLLIQVSMIYMKTPPPSTVLPYAVQMFGFLQWKKSPIIFAKFIQVINVHSALRLKQAIEIVTSRHLAKPKEVCNEETNGIKPRLFLETN